MCFSVGLLHVFVYILRFDMLDVEEIPYSPSPEMSSHTAQKLILFLHPIFMRSETYWCCIPRHIQCTLVFYWPPSNLNLTRHRSRWNDMKYILLLMLLCLCNRNHDMLWRSLFVLLSFFFWPLCCLSFFFDLRILITSLVSSKSSYIYLFF